MTRKRENNPAPGREEAFNDWFDNRHLHDVLAVPGIATARRFRRKGEPLGGACWDYCAIYDIEGNDPAPW